MRKEGEGRGRDVVPEQSTERRGVRFGHRAVYKGKDRKRRGQEDCPIQSPTVFQVKVTRL